MNYKELQEFISQEHKRMLDRYGVVEGNEKELLYPISLKIMEEVGELAEAVLHNQNYQRKEKIDILKEGKKEPRVGEEMADVILATHFLAENMGINLEAELEKKMKKIEERK